jgi:hypothetical protein
MITQVIHSLPPGGGGRDTSVRKIHMSLPPVRTSGRGRAQPAVLTGRGRVRLPRDVGEDGGRATTVR